MKLHAAQLAAHTKRNGLAPIYLLSGGEPLQEMECADFLRAEARRQGYIERTVYTVENARFNWAQLRAEAGSLSLFAAKRLLEVRLGNKIPVDKDNNHFTNSSTLADYFTAPPADTLLLLTLNKLDAKARQRKWFRGLDKHGVVVEYSVPEAAHMPAWVQKRLNAAGLQASPEAVEMLAARGEGHLLAAAQEIEKLRLLYAGQSITPAQIMESVADSARFNIFAWLDTVLDGDAALLTRQMKRLREEGVEAIQIQSLLEREIRNLCQISFALRSGQNQNQAFSRYRVWSNRKAIVSRALQRHKTGRWARFLRRAAFIEQIIKGSAAGNAWDELWLLALHIAGSVPVGLER